MIKDNIYTEMCSFLADKESILNEFKLFYEHNRDDDNFLELFDEEYGAMYDTFNGQVKINTYSSMNKNNDKPKELVKNIEKAHISTQEYREDVRTIRKWVCFLGIVAIASIILSLIWAIIIIAQ